MSKRRIMIRQYYSIQIFVFVDFAKRAQREHHIFSRIEILN